MSDVLTPHPSEQTHPPVDSLATAALVTGIFSLLCSLVCRGILLGPAAAIMGFMARGRVAARGGTVRGSGQALAGMGLGLLGLVASVVWLLFFVITSGSNLQEFLKAP